jgi:thiopeptide-type bacteriocin biosynthesis protein
MPAVSSERPEPVGDARDPERRVDLELSPYAVLRAAAWPVEALDPYAAPALAALARDVLEATRAVDAARAEVAERLGALVPRLAGAAERGLVLGVRRAVHRGDTRHPALAAVLALIRPLDPGLAEALVVDDGRRARRAALADELAHAHDDVLAEERRALRRVGATDAFRTALVVGNEEVAERWQRLLATEAERGDGAPSASSKARVRRLENAVLDHLCRAAGRVVPSAGWAGVAAVLPSGEGRPGPLLAVRPAPADVRVEPELGAFEEVVIRLASGTSVAAGHPLRIDPKAAWGDPGSDPLVRLLLDAFGAEVRTAPAMIAALARALGGSAGAEAALVGALEQLLERGIVVSAAVLPRGAVDAWAALERVTPWLVDGARRRWCDALHALGESCAQLADAVTAHQPRDAAAALGAARRVVDGLRHAAGAGPWEAPPVRVVSRLPVEATWGAEGRARTGDAVRAVLARFAADGVAEAFRRASVAPLAAALADGAGDDGGGPVPVLDLLGRPPFAARGARQTADDADTWTGAGAPLGDVELAGAVATAAAAWERWIPAEPGVDAVRLPDAAPIETAPARPGPVGSLRFEVGADGLVFRGGRPEPGFGALARRTWFPELDEELGLWLASWADDGVEAVELVGADPSNANAALGSPLAARRVGPVPDGLDPRRLGLRIDGEGRPFLVELDAEGAEATGGRLVPLHPHASAVGSANALSAGLWRVAQAQCWEWVGLGVPLLPSEVEAGGGRPRGLPRVEGQPGVVLAPRRWVLDPGELRAIARATGADRYLAWRGLAERLGLPALVLVRTSPDPETPERLVRTDGALAVRAFLDAVAHQQPRRLVARELPGDPSRWPVVSTRGHHLAELVVSWRDRNFWRAAPDDRPRPDGTPGAQPAGEWCQVVWAVPASPTGDEPLVPWRRLEEAVAELTGAGARHVWYVRKTGVRLRAWGDPDTLTPILRRCSQDGLRAGEIQRATEPVYEPEEARFGGPAGLALAHELFHADTPLALREVRLGVDAAPPLHRAVAAVVVATDLIGRVVLDPAEVWDVWQRLDTLAARLGESRPGAPAAVDVDRLVVDPEGCLAPALVPLLAEGRALATGFGPRLQASALDGTLRVGVRAWLAAATLFAWNRRDLPLHPAELRAAIAGALRATAP